MPSSLRARLALVGVLAVLLIPIGLSSLRGLTHVLTCEEAAGTPFSVDLTAAGEPIITSSQVIVREPVPAGDGATAERAPGGLCGGLDLEMRMTSRDADSAEITLDITNRTEFGWRGSVRLQIDETSIPVTIGEIAPGDTATDTVELDLAGEERYELEGSLLVGP